MSVEVSEAVPGVPVLRETRLNVVKPAAPVEGRVVSTRLVTRGGRKAAGFVRHVEIDVSGTELAGSFIAGQSFGVVPPGEDERGRPHRLRLYSISSPSRGEDGEGRVLATCVKRLIDEHWETQSLHAGVASNYLCSLREGDKVQVTGPSGKRFVLPVDYAEHDYIFIATGTGIAPFRGMITDLLEAGCQSRILLIMGTPYASDLLYDDEMRGLAERHPNFRYVTAISREPQADTPEHLYVQKRLSIDPLGADHPDAVTAMLRSERTLVYICGIAGMELGVFAELAAVLNEGDLAQYLDIDEDARDPTTWQRRMVSRQIRPTKRVFLEVY